MFMKYEIETLMEDQIEILKNQIHSLQKQREDTLRTVNELAERYLKESRLREELQKDHDEIKFDNEFLAEKLQELERENESLRSKVISRLDNITELLTGVTERNPNQIDLFDDK